MDRSPGFGSYTRNYRAVHTRFPCGSASEMLNLAAYINSPDRSTKSTTSHFNVLCVLVNIRFQVLFHSPPGVLFTFPSQYCSAIGHQVVFRLGGWSPRLLTGFLVSADTLDTVRSMSPFAYKTVTSSGWLFHTIRLGSTSHVTVRTPRILLSSVWPLPLSLATTHRISFDFSSSGYLDVSVPRVPHVKLWIYLTFHGSSPWGFPHSEIRGSKLICSSPRLIAACHVLLRLPVPRHSPYALFRLNFSQLLVLVLYCLSFANNCLGFSH